jgi:hypothetical protein
MAQTEKLADTPQAEDKSKDKGKDAKGKVADYLQAPRKKRKSYVLMALSHTVKEDLASGIEAFLRSGFKNIAVSVPKTPEELFRNFSRQIVLLVFDDEFAELSAGLGMIAELKRRKNQSVIPVLFLTRDPARLIEAYNKMLAPFHEADDYVDHAKSDTSLIYSKIRAGLTTGNRRRSRRYNVDQPLQFYLLTDDRLHPGRLVDLSIHGAQLKSEEERIFAPGEQLKLHLPVTQYLAPAAGDYLKISARVRRVFISGTIAGISFEHMSEKQLMTVTHFLTEMVNDQAARKMLATKARAPRS